MIYTKEVENMCQVKKGVDHGPAPIPEEGKWIQAKAYEAVEWVDFDNKYMRHDIGRAIDEA